MNYYRIFPIFFLLLCVWKCSCVIYFTLQYYIVWDFLFVRKKDHSYFIMCMFFGHLGTLGTNDLHIVTGYECKITLFICIYVKATYVII